MKFVCAVSLLLLFRLHPQRSAYRPKTVQIHWDVVAQTKICVNKELYFNWLGLWMASIMLHCFFRLQIFFFSFCSSPFFSALFVFDRMTVNRWKSNKMMPNWKTKSRRIDRIVSIFYWNKRKFSRILWRTRDPNHPLKLNRWDGPRKTKKSLTPESECLFSICTLWTHFSFLIHETDFIVIDFLIFTFCCVAQSSSSKDRTRRRWRIACRSK